MPKKAEQTTVVTTHEENALVALQAVMTEFAGAGLEGIGAQDRAIPFIGIVQSLSPQRKKNDAKFIDGAEEGDVFNTVTESLVKGDVGLRVIPVHYQKVWNLWIPREKGGGFLASYADKGLTQPIIESQRLTEYDGEPQVTETANHFVLVEEPDGTWMPALLSMTSTKLKVSRNWATRMTMVRLVNAVGEKVPAPAFARVYLLRTVAEENEKGAYHNYKIDDDGWVTNELFQEAVRFRDQLLAGQLRVDYTKADDVPGGGGPVPDFEDDGEALPEM